MKNFARQWVDPVFQFSSLLFLVVVHTAILAGMVIGLAVRSWIIGVCSGGGLVLLCYTFLVLVWYCSQRYVTYCFAFVGVSHAGFILHCHNLRIKIQPLLNIL
jgi:ankyrin repeat-rich membrane spanning protein